MQSPTLFQNFKSFTNPHACMSCLPCLLRCLPCDSLMINFIKLLQWGNIINIRSIINLWGFIPKFMSLGIVNPSAINLSFFQVFTEDLKYSEKNIYVDIRLLLSTMGCGVSLYALLYDYLNPFPKSKIVLIVCVLSYLFRLWKQISWWVVLKIFMFCGKTYLVMSQAEMMISYFVTCLMWRFQSRRFLQHSF